MKVFFGPSCQSRRAVDGVAGAVEGDGVDYGEVVDAAMLEGEGEVAADFADGAGELEAVTLLADGGFAGGERIAGVDPGTADGGEEGAVVGLLAGLGVDLDAAAVEGGLAVLGGELVGIDLDVGDGALGRETAAVLKSVDGDSGVGGISSGCGGELLEFAEEVVGVVGEGLELGAGDGGGWAAGLSAGDCAGVAVYVDFGFDGLGL
jgi:hypothetical protein